MSYKIIGRITTKKENKAIPGLKVEVWDKDLGNIDEYLGDTKTNELGEFTVEYTQEDFNHWGKDDNPDLYLIITNKNGAIIYSSEEKVKQEAGKEEYFDVRIAEDLLNKEPDIKPKDRYEEILRKLK